MPYRALLWSEVPSLARLEAQEWLHHRSHSSQGIELPCKLCWHQRIRLHEQNGTHTVLDAQNSHYAGIIHTCGFPRRAAWISVDAGGSGRHDWRHWRHRSGRHDWSHRSGCTTGATARRAVNCHVSFAGTIAFACTSNTARIPCSTPRTASTRVSSIPAAFHAAQPGLASTQVAVGGLVAPAGVMAGFGELQQASAV